MLLWLLNMGFAGGVGATTAPYFPGQKTSVEVTTQSNTTIATSNPTNAAAVSTPSNKVVE